MTVNEYFNTLRDQQQVTFVVARARKDDFSPYYHAEYINTPTYTVLQMRRRNNELLGYNIINNRQIPIDWACGVPHGEMIRTGRLRCFLVISDEALAMIYPDKRQRKAMLDYIDKTMVV